MKRFDDVRKLQTQRLAAVTTPRTRPRCHRRRRRRQRRRAYAARQSL